MLGFRWVKVSESMKSEYLLSEMLGLRWPTISESIISEDILSEMLGFRSVKVARV